MSLDPSSDYSSASNENYYTLWHWRRGEWVSYGYLPVQNPIHWSRARPFQIKLERDRWGLKSGWHIIHVYSYSPYGTDQPTYKKILRLRHVGKRIPQDQSGYLAPNYLDDNWEILGEKTFSAEEFGGWYAGDAIRTRGAYRPIPGIIYDSDDRQLSYQHWEEGDSVGIYCWDGDPLAPGFYNFRNYAEEDTVPDFVMQLLAPWPGTTNRILGAYYQMYDVLHSYRNPFSFNPSSIDDTQFWDSLQVNEYPKNWYMVDPRDVVLGAMDKIWKYSSNFWFLGTSFDPGELPTFDDYIIFQGPNNWRTLNQIIYGGSFNEPDLGTSIWDWEWDCSCAESNMVMAYVRRKSDGTIWKFRNWNQATDIYTNFINLDPKPINPTPGQEYMSFFMEGPPIPGNETWNTLMVLK